MLTTVTGLIIRTADVKESDRLVTIFTEETGVITAIAKGARSIKSRQMSATLQFCYGRYVLYQKNDFYWIKEAELIESFFDIRKRLEGLALASYLCEFLSDVTVSEADKELLRLSKAAEDIPAFHPHGQFACGILYYPIQPTRVW